MHNKRTLLCLAIAILVLISFACTCALPGLNSGPSIVGTWEGPYEDMAITFIFQNDGNFIFLIDGTEVGRGRYVVDMSADPIPLDLIYSDGGAVNSIIKFPDANTMWMENVDFGEPRPATFFDYAVLTRANP